MNKSSEITLTITDQVNQINDRIIDLSEQLPQYLSVRKYSEAKLTIDSMLVLLTVLERLHTIEHELSRLPDLLGSLTQSTKQIIQLETAKTKLKPKPKVEKIAKPVVIQEKVPLKKPVAKQRIKKESTKETKRGRPSREVLASIERLPRHEQKDFYFPILEVLSENNGQQTGALTIMGVKNKFSNKLLAGDFEIIGSNNAHRWQVVARWAQNKLKQLGFVTSLERGIWALTETGRALLNGQIALSPEQIDKLKEPVKQ